MQALPVLSHTENSPGLRFWPDIGANLPGAVPESAEDENQSAINSIYTNAGDIKGSLSGKKMKNCNH